MNSTLELTSLLIGFAYLSFVFLLVYIFRIYAKSKRLDAKQTPQEQALKQLKSSKKYQELLQQYHDIQSIKQRNHTEYARQIHLWRNQAVHFGTRKNVNIVALIENTDRA